MNKEVSYSHPKECSSLLAPQIKINRKYVHKTHLENVYTNSVHKITNKHYVAKSQVPVISNDIIEDASQAMSHPTIVVEMFRQASMAICHLFLGVDLTDVCILHNFKLNLDQKKLAIISNDESDCVDFNIYMDKLEYSKTGQLASIVMSYTGSFKGIEIYNGKSTWGVQTRNKYLRLRSIARKRHKRKPTDITPPIRVLPSQKTSISTVNKSWHKKFFVNVDQNNVFFFDHPNDHIPGMLILDSGQSFASFCRNNSDSEAEYRVGTVEVTFNSFAELDSPTAIEHSINNENDNTLNIEFQQKDTTVASCSVMLTDINETILA